MTRDIYLRILFIPLLGISLPLISGMINYVFFSPLQLVAANFFFILTSFTIWTGSHWIHKKLRPLFSPHVNPFAKIVTVGAAASLYGAGIGSFAYLAWLKASGSSFDETIVTRFLVLCVVAVVVFTLIYEILFLSQERERDNKLVNEMGRELSQAELQALSNEMDPHFVFNSLNAMNHLILHNPMQAHLFNNNLAQVFKYFLLNKTRDLIPLKDEISFIRNYFFLLQIRYEDKLQLQLALGDNYQSIMIPPCALQVLIENAIKHNEFSEERPLMISVVMNGHYLKVSNNYRPRPYSLHSTHTGLSNLRARFRLICRKEIVVEQTRELFTVKLPVIKNLKTKSHDKDSDH